MADEQESPPVGAKFAWRITNITYDATTSAESLTWLAVAASYGLEGEQVQLRMSAVGLAERSPTDAILGAVELEVRTPTRCAICLPLPHTP